MPRSRPAPNVSKPVLDIECSLEASSLSGNVRNQFGAQNTTPSPVQPWATIPEIIIWDVA